MRKTITFSNGVTITHSTRGTAIKFRYYEKQGQDSPICRWLINDAEWQKIGDFADAEKAAGFRAVVSLETSSFSPDRLDAVTAFATEMWGQPVPPEADAPKPEAPKTEAGPELISSDDTTGPYPWLPEERDNWWYVQSVAPTGKSLTWYRRTASAHAIGRAALAAAPSDVTSVRVYEYDFHTNTTPAFRPDTDEVIEIENAGPVAVVNDPTPVGAYMARAEEALEEARMMQRRFEAARKVLGHRLWEHYRSIDENADEYRSANQLAAMARGVISRPTLLNLLRVDEEEADL